MMEREYHEVSDGIGRFMVESFYEPKTPGKISEYNYLLPQASYIRPIVVKDARTDIKYVIERHLNSFNDTLESKGLLAEARFGKLCTHPNVHSVCDVMLPDVTSTKFDTIIFVKPHMDCNLMTILRSKQILTIDHARYFLYQILCALNYLSSAGIVHQKICPENILLDANCDLKIAGLQFHWNYIEEDPPPYTSQYKALDVHLLHPSSDKKAQTVSDVWSAGCIFEEVLNHSAGGSKLRPFQGTVIDKVKGFYGLFGRPSDEEIDADESYIENLKAKEFIKRLPRRTTPCTMTDLCPLHAEEDDAADLLFRMLRLDPRERISVQDALAHPFFDDYRDIPIIEEMDVEQEAGFQFDFLASMTLDGHVEADEPPSYDSITTPELMDHIKSLWWRDFYQRDPALPEVYPGHAQHLACMRWKMRKGFLLFLYRARFWTFCEHHDTSSAADLSALDVKASEIYSDEVPFALSAVFQNRDLVRFLLQFV